MSVVQAGDAVLLIGPDGERHIVRARNETARVGGLGVVALGQMVGKEWGSQQRIGLKDYVLVRPSLADHARALERRAQIILPKDAARILYETGIGPGDRVLEAGAGSGALTIALAHAVAPTGKVIALDLREDHLAVARRNVEATPWADVVEFRTADVRQGVGERGLDAAILDIPDPEAAIPALHESLRPGATIAVYVPLVSQVEKAVAAARKAGLVDVRARELIERNWIIHERGARPDFEMLGHTGFLVFARRV